MVIDYNCVGEASKVYYSAKQNLEIENIKWPSEVEENIFLDYYYLFMQLICNIKYQSCQKIRNKEEFINDKRKY